jgi:hypothetical protein
MEYQVDLDKQTTQKCVDAIIKATSLEDLAGKINLDVFFRRTSDGHHLSVIGIEKSLAEAAVVLPEVSRFLRPNYFGQQIVRILGPLNSLERKDKPVVNPSIPFIFVSSEDELEGIKQTVARDGEKFISYQHQLWLSQDLYFLQQNTYTGKKKKLFRSSCNLDIKPEPYGFNIHGFHGPIEHIHPKELMIPLLKRFLNGYLGHMEECARKESVEMADYRLKEFKKSDWCILPAHKDFAAAVENNLSQLGLTKVNKTD